MKTIIAHVKVLMLLAHSRGCEVSDVDCGLVDGKPINIHGYMTGHEA